MRTVIWRSRQSAQIMAQDGSRVRGWCDVADCSSGCAVTDIDQESTGGQHCMMADWIRAQSSSHPHGSRVLDTAQGILIGLRRCSSETALHELLSVAQRHRMPVFAMAWALVHLAGGSEKSPHIFIEAQSAARHEWGRFFAASAV